MKWKHRTRRKGFNEKYYPMIILWWLALRRFEVREELRSLPQKLQGNRDWQWWYPAGRRSEWVHSQETVVGKLTAKWGLICPMGAVRDAITHWTQIHTDAMAGALPLPTGTQKWLGRAVFLITHIPAVIVPITEPVSEDAVSIGTEETRGRASSGGTATVLIRSSEAVWVPIALPAIRNADAIFSALEFILAAHPGRPGC